MKKYKLIQAGDSYAIKRAWWAGGGMLDHAGNHWWTLSEHKLKYAWMDLDTASMWIKRLQAK